MSLVIEEEAQERKFGEIPRETWQEYERRKGLISNIGLKSWEYEREVHKIAVELGIEEA